MVATTPSIVRPRWYARLELGTFIPGALLAALMIWSVTRSLIVSNWADGMEILMAIALPALLVGLVFARLAWLPGWLAHLLSAGLGIAWTVQRVGPVLQARVADEYGDVLAARLNTWVEQASELVLRGLIWLRILQAGGRGEDVILFVVTVALLMWTLGYLTGWFLFRTGRVWLAIVLNALVILLNYTFIFPKPSALFFIFLGSALLVIVYQHVIAQQRVWRAALLEIPSSLVWRAVLAAGLFCGALVILTSMLPGTVTSTEAQRAWRVLRSPFASLRESWQDAFSTINAPPGTSGSFATRSVGVGGPRTLGDQVVMRVRTSKYDYLRAVAFDRYTGHNWQNTVGERARAALGVPTAEQARTLVEAGKPLVQAELLDRELITQTIELAQTRTDGLLMVSGQLRTAGVPVMIQHGVLVDSSNQTVPNYTEMSSVVAEVPLEESGTYTVSTYISNVDEQSLRQAGTNYPQWVSATYTQLPDTVPQRVRDRATELAGSAATPYDKALAIQAYLRTLPYDERRQAPPDDRDWVDYFLFEGQRGYCDDFATAMVVLLRSVDVPARWVQGYAGGTLDPDKGDWIVRESVAHSWVEAYFPGYGWQRFEPTPAPYAIVPARPAVPAKEEDDSVTPSDDVSNALSDPDEIMRRLREQNEGAESGMTLEELQRLIAEREAEARREQLLLFGGIGGALALLLGLVVVWLWLDVRGLSPAAAAYARLTRLGGWAGIPLQPNVTPREYAAEVGRELPDRRDSVERIASAYVAERYQPGHSAQAEDAALAWGDVRPSLVRRMVARLFSGGRGDAGATQRGGRPAPRARR
jgi:transglutaminase-like putative cysteine protease